MHSNRRSGFLGKATPRPCHRHPDPRDQHRDRQALLRSALAELAVVVMRIKGCQPKATIWRKSQRAYKARSVITITVQPGGTGRRRRGAGRATPGARDASLACKTFQATGMAGCERRH